MVNVNAWICYVVSCAVYSVSYRFDEIKECMNMKYRLKKLWKRVKLYFSLPHFWVVGIVLLLSGAVFILSVLFKDSNPFFSSVFANIFAGLITGLVICFISAIKAMSLYKTECLIRWLTLLHEDILEYMGMQRKLMLFKNEEELNSDEALYNYIYDTLCCGVNINATISQGRFKESLPFNPYEYFKKEFKYDAVSQSKENDKLREKIMVLDVSNITSKELRILFKNMDKQLFMLNNKILKHVTNLEARKKAINVSLM